jgi:hypothetical protein
MPEVALVMKCRREYTTGICEAVVMGSQIWFLELVIMVVLVIIEVELSLEPPVDQG